jgi:hypothetical protein
MQPDEGLFTRQQPTDRFREQTDPVLSWRTSTSLLMVSRR